MVNIIILMVIFQCFILNKINCLFYIFSVVNSVSINNDVLTVVGVALMAHNVGWGWLVHGPVVHWWVLSWVKQLRELDWAFLFVLNLVISDQNLVSKHGASHRVLHKDWVDEDWDSLGEGGGVLLWLGESGGVLLWLGESGGVLLWLGESGGVLLWLGESGGVLLWLGESGGVLLWLGEGGGVLLWLGESGGVLWTLVQKNFIVTDGDLEVKFLFSGQIFLEDWLDKHWLSAHLSSSEWLGNWGLLVSNQSLEVSLSDVVVGENVINIIWVLEAEKSLGSVLFWFSLSKLGGDWRWSIGDEVLESSSGHVLVEKDGKVIGITLLCKLGGDWRWSISNKVLEGTSGNVLIEENRKVVAIRFLGLHIELNQRVGNWSLVVLDEVDKGLLGDVLTVKLSNHSGLSLSLSSLSPVWHHIVEVAITIVVWESLVEGIGK